MASIGEPSCSGCPLSSSLAQASVSGLLLKLLNWPSRQWLHVCLLALLSGCSCVLRLASRLALLHVWHCGP